MRNPESRNKLAESRRGFAVAQGYSAACWGHPPSSFFRKCWDLGPERVKRGGPGAQWHTCALYAIFVPKLSWERILAEILESHCSSRWCSGPAKYEGTAYVPHSQAGPNYTSFQVSEEGQGSHPRSSHTRPTQCTDCSTSFSTSISIPQKEVMSCLLVDLLFFPLSQKTNIGNASLYSC